MSKLRFWQCVFSLFPFLVHYRPIKHNLYSMYKAYQYKLNLCNTLFGSNVGNKNWCVSKFNVFLELSNKNVVVFSHTVNIVQYKHWYGWPRVGHSRAQVKVSFHEYPYGHCIQCTKRVLVQVTKRCYISRSLSERLRVYTTLRSTMNVSVPFTYFFSRTCIRTHVVFIGMPCWWKKFSTIF